MSDLHCSKGAVRVLGKIPVILLILLQPCSVMDYLRAQTILNADGPGDTYELINSVLAPGYNVIEAPDCSHPEFGRHIDEVYDSALGKYVFRFHIHVIPDNDRCINFDRQRNEIKTYDKSPDSLKAVSGEKVQYEFRFRIDSAFQSSSSFTHLHQLKAVGGPEEDMPLIALTARKGSPDKLQVRYSETTTQTTIHQVSLDPFKGNWVEVKEVVKFGESGTYSLVINRFTDSTNLLNYNNDNIRMWKTDASFVRPKWGIYRSLLNKDDLRDEMVCFSDFIVTELETIHQGIISPLAGTFSIYPNPARDHILLNPLPRPDPCSVVIYDASGRIVLSGTYQKGNSLDISSLAGGIYMIKILYGEKTYGSSRFVKY